MTFWSENLKGSGHVEDRYRWEEIISEWWKQ